MAVFAAACPFDFVNGDHCAANGGDASCREADENTPFCALDGCDLYDESSNRTGCVAQRPEEASCYSPCGGQQDMNADGTCLDGTGSLGSSTTDPTSMTSEPSSGESTTSMSCDCDADTPICLEDSCVACEDDAFCDTQFGDELGICESNDCVACRPEMDGVSGVHQGCGGVSAGSLVNCGPDATCTPLCLFPDDCAATACDEREGICGPRDQVFHVDPSADAELGEGTEALPFATIQRAVEAIGSQGGAFKIGTIMLAPGDYEEAVLVQSATVMVRPRDLEGPRPTIRAPQVKEGSQPAAFTLLSSNAGDNANLSIAGVALSGNPGFAVRIEASARFFADDVEMFANGGALEIDGGGGFMRNSIVAMSSTETDAAFVFTNEGEFAFVSSTLIENTANPLMFDCRHDDVSLLSIRDSIVGEFAADADFEAMVDTECLIVGNGPIRSVVGALGEGSFRENYRLDAGADASFILEEDVGACEPGEQIDEEGFLLPCPPSRDIDGNPRGEVNYKGASTL